MTLYSVVTAMRAAMPSSPQRRAGKQAAAEVAAAVSGREPRGARRKRETRDKLLDAAFRLMAERGMDAVAINEITEAADVGFGSFYNHFESKEAIYAAVMDAVFENFGDALDRLVQDVDDPAEVIAISVRHTILRARREPLWGRFLVREGFSARVLSRGLGVRLMRDIQKGVAKGRFKVPDPLMGFIAVGAGVLGAIAIGLQLDGEPPAELKRLGLNARDMPERAAAVLLTHLGLSFEQAQRIAQRPLPLAGSALASS
jgi:AcrR family transcriptional regulator